jgi:hypothetical protein
MAKRVGKKKEGQEADELEGLPPLNRNAAGIDASRGMWLCRRAVMGSRCKSPAVSRQICTG